MIKNGKDMLANILLPLLPLQFSLFLRFLIFDPNSAQIFDFFCEEIRRPHFPIRGYRNNGTRQPQNGKTDVDGYRTMGSGH